MSLSDLTCTRAVAANATTGTNEIHRMSITNTNIQDLDERVFEVPIAGVGGGGVGGGGGLGVVPEGKVWASLTHLSLTHSKLKTVPRAVAKIPSLRHLDLQSNHIDGIFPYTFFGRSKVSHNPFGLYVLPTIRELKFWTILLQQI